MTDLPDLARTEAAIVMQTNAFRREQRLGEVKPDPKLTEAARAFAAYLARTGRFAHEADGRKPAERIAAAGYKYCQVSENLALNQDSRGFTTDRLATAAVEGWKNSPGHRRNMVEPGVVEIGVGVARAPDPAPKFLSVQLFGRPERLKVQFKVSNRADVGVSYTTQGRSTTIEPRVVITHTTCATGDIVFERAGNLLTGTRLDVRLPVSDGATFTLVKGGDGKVKVEPQRASGSKPR